MDIFVVSRGRHTRCVTLESLGNLAPYPVSLVVHKSEESLYEPLAEKHGVELVGLEYDGIAQKRSLIGTQLVSAIGCAQTMKTTPDTCAFLDTAQKITYSASITEFVLWKTLM